MRQGFWSRLESRAVAGGAFEILEDKRTLVRVTMAILLGIVLMTTTGSTIYFGHGETVAGWALLGLGISYVPTTAIFLVTGNVQVTAFSALTFATAAQLTMHISLGGYANSGGVMLWTIQSTVMIAVSVRWRWARVYFVGCVIIALVLVFVEGPLRDRRAAPDPDFIAQSLTLVLIGTLITVIPLLRFLVKRLSLERARAEALLLNVLPTEVATELKDHGSVTARRYDSISVLFADIVGFTPMSAELDPEEMVDHLNRVFSHFDVLTDEFGCEKIRTIGDNYMVAAGIPYEREDHAVVLACMALRMRDFADETPFRFRIGINSGPAVAGVIGTRKFQYDVWGATVNTASRMESLGEPGRIQITDATRTMLGDRFECTPRGTIDVKGAGPMATWWLIRERGPDGPQERPRDQAASSPSRAGSTS